jgi:hypothetical protein
MQNDATSKVRIPASLMIAFGSIAGLWTLISTVLGDPEGERRLSQIDRRSPELAEFLREHYDLIYVGSGVLGIAVAALIVAGGIAMLRGRSYGLALAGAIAATIPCCNACCCILPPFGIWAIVMLRKAEVRAAFGRGPDRRVPPEGDWTSTV